MHFFGGAAGEVYQIQSLNTVSHHANQLNNISVGLEVVNKVFIKGDKLKEYVSAAEKGVFVFGEHTGVEPFLGKDIYNKVVNKFNSLSSSKDYRGKISTPLNFKIRTFANEVSFRRAYELWLWLCSDNNPNKDKIHARFRQSKTAACINYQQDGLLLAKKLEVMNQGIQNGARIYHTSGIPLSGALESTEIKVKKYI